LICLDARVARLTRLRSATARPAETRLQQVLLLLLGALFDVLNDVADCL